LAAAIIDVVPQSASAALTVNFTLSAKTCLGLHYVGPQCEDKELPLDAQTNATMAPLSRKYYTWEVAPRTASMQLRYHGSLLQAAVRYLGVPFGNASDITLRQDETADVPVPGVGRWYLLIENPGELPQDYSISLSTTVCADAKYGYFCNITVTNFTDSDASMFRLGGGETFSGVFRSQELRIGVTAQTFGRLAPVLLLRAGALPTDDAWDVRADFPLLSAIATNESIDQDWFFVAEPRNQTPYALWLHTICPSDCGGDECVTEGAEAGRCRCFFPSASVDCGVEIPRLLEYLYLAAIPAATIIVALVGALYYYLRKDRLIKELYSRIRDEDT
jgi:hypothetical protein